MTHISCEIITTVHSANIHILIDKFLLVMRTHRIYFFNNFPLYHTAVLAIVLITSPVVSYLTTGSLYTF